MKKFLTLIFAFTSVFVLVACGAKDYTVTFDAKGGEAVESQKVKKGKHAENPGAPVATEELADYDFRGWFLNLEEGAAFEFKTEPITKNITLYAKWVEKAKSLLSFNTKVDGVSVPSQELITGVDVPVKPANPTRTGYNFKGWYATKPGYSWNDLVEFDLTKPLSKDTTVHAYWEPINSKNAVYTAGETYKVAMSADSDHINPLTYTDSGQSSFISLLSGSLFTKDIDWDKAIAEGYATREGDFSKFSTEKEEKEFSISNLTYKYNMEMAAEWPADANGDNFVQPDGGIDHNLAAQVKSSTWTFKIKPGLIFENGDPINAGVYEYTFKQYLDPIQLNSRSNGLIDANYLNLKNAQAYLNGDVQWDAVGFKKVDDLTFTTTHATDITQAQALDMIDLPTLVNETAYENGFTSSERRTNNYGTPNNRLVSYGPYVIKEWSHKQKWVLNKNFDYINKKDIVYKSYEYQIIENEATREKQFSEGKLNVFGLSATYYSKYAKDESLLAEPEGWSMSLSFNNNARGDSKAVPSIVGDHNFRKAVFHAIDRDDFAIAAAAPDVGSLGLLSDMHISAIENLEPYNKSKYHADVLNDPELDLNPESLGYNPSKAKSLFNTAYDKWVSEGNNGKFTLELLTRGSSVYYEGMADYIKEVLEETFGADKINISITKLTGDAYSGAVKAYNYDMAFNGMGGATHIALFFTYAIYGNLNGPGTVFEPGFDIPNLEVEFDFADYFNLLKTKNAAELEDYEKLFLDGGTIKSGEKDIVIKGVDATGKWKGTVSEFATFSGYTIEDNSDYPMKHDVHYYAISVLEKAFLKVMATVPLTATAASTVYNGVNVDWPEFHMLFGWGSQKYRHLTQDPDFIK